MDKQNTNLNELKKNRMSFKEFQQQYEEQNFISKQKRKSQQQSLQKLAINNIKPLQNNSKERGTVVDLTKHNKSSAVSQPKKWTDSLSLTELNSLNSSIAFPSNFVSPKASNQTLMKSINLASTKSKQFSKNILISSVSKQKLIDPKLATAPKHNPVINLNCGNPKKHNEKNIPQQMQQIQKNMKKVSSISKMTTTDLGDASLLSFPSQKTFQVQSNQLSTMQYVSFLVSELNFLNQVFSEIETEEISQNHEQKRSQFSYKSKLLAQIKNKLDKQSEMFGLDIKNEEGPIKQLHDAVLTLLHNYETDLKQSSLKSESFSQNNRFSSKMPLSIKIGEEQEHKNDLEVNHKRQQSKKKTIKLSKSRLTQEETINSQSKVRQYFETSEFSILNTSKITEVSRPSSQNKNLPYTMNEIEHVIHSKIINNQENNSKGHEKNEEQKPKYDLGIRSKVQLRNGYKSTFEKGQSWDEGKKKIVSKTISLISNNNGSVERHFTSKNYPSVPKCTKIPIKSMKENANSMNIHAQGNSMKIKSINLVGQKRQKNKLEVNLSNQNSPAPSMSHNQSIYELQFLDNYPGFNPASNYSSIQPKYSQELFR